MPDPDAPCVGGIPVCLTDEDWSFYLNAGIEENAHSEYSLLTMPFSDALMDYNRMAFHAVALRWQDKAYLIAAPSGVGKSTQARFLQELRPGEFGVISGDRPILEFRKKETHFSDEIQIDRSDSTQILSNPEGHWDIIVHPSQWNGKENWFGAKAAPLAGLILLLRGDQNELISLTPREAAIRCYNQVIQTFISPDKIRKAAELTTRLLNSVPIWQLTTYQVPESTKLLVKSIFSSNSQTEME